MVKLKRTFTGFEEVTKVLNKSYKLNPAVIS